MFILAVIIAIISGLLILEGSKSSIGMLIFIFLSLIYTSAALSLGFKKTNKFIAYIIIATVAFPYLIQFKGKDAFTITTLLIYFIFIVLALSLLIAKKKIALENFRSAYFMPFLILIGFTFSFIFNPYFIAQSTRYYAANVSGILLYFIIITMFKKHNDIILSIKIILLILILQCGISYLQLQFPAAANYLIPFGTRIDTPRVSIVEGMLRATGTIWDYELLAEWFLIGAVLSIYLIFERKNYLYILGLFINLGGILFTKTRSDIFLFSFAFIIMFILINLFKKDFKGATIKIFLLAALGIILLVFIFPRQVDEFIRRLNLYFYSHSLISPEALNRREVWNRAGVLLKNPTIFGKGLYNVESLSISAGSFHSLYLTLLYKIGIFGISAHIIFWLTMLSKAWYILTHRKNSRNWYVIFFLFIAVILMLADGIKIEYFRYAHTIQFAWLIYALLVVSLIQSEDKNENIMVSQAAI